MRKRSWQVDERILRQHILPIFARHPLQDISRNDVAAWLGSLAAKGLAPATCNRILSVFKSVCSLAVIRGVLPVSPCMGIAPFPIRQLRERYLARHEARRLLQALHDSPRLEAKALQLLLLTGARKSEILKARWEHIHLEQHLLTVPLSKSNRPRHIVLSDEAVAIIRHLPRRPDCPWLFPGRTAGRPLADIYLFWNQLRRQLHFADVRIHDLRHTFASILVNAGHSLYEVQRLLGHCDPRTTMRYAHMGHDSLLAAAGTIGTLLGSTPAVSPSRPRKKWPLGTNRIPASRKLLEASGPPFRQPPRLPPPSFLSRRKKITAQEKCSRRSHTRHFTKKL
ncbi:site-specific integrase [Desulfovibrio sp. ZJ200]|uniref:tyrosine-type recombinase/integrase n=1 Tax=Desulfovibrio sp. ZJ200 TaxID=2709792 RepID=UPI001F14A9C3|nr:site-specific integrase [Desulfovibrio sp. ZJ200]